MAADLLDLSRIVRGKLTLKRAPAQLDSLVRAGVEACRSEAARAGVVIETQVSSGLWVDADPDRFEQIVTNLVSNGVKFTPRGGRVTVSTRPIDGAAAIVVEDTGVGIEPERFSEIFAMFRQGQVASMTTPGLGIGLALRSSGARPWT